ncbi:hypothetical protein OCOJLMKI_1201 [Methylobacterium iners]|uniref:Uncharacterized protein n=1 Tax=Methylobacterium iners TaxID=418707 RepID=A0ABQ4RV27_9HYPH|nr:hypothetical protein OCOJLMKI_1201 [Methylobacterium iners]
MLALKPYGVALERGHPRERDQVLGEELAHALELAANERDLAFRGSNSLGQPVDVMAQLDNTLTPLRFLSFTPRDTSCEQAALAIQQVGNDRVAVTAFEEVGREGH